MTTTSTTWEHLGTEARPGRLVFWSNGHQAARSALAGLIGLVRCVQHRTASGADEAAALVAGAQFEETFMGYCPARHDFALCAADGTGSGYYDLAGDELACHDVEPVTLAVVASPGASGPCPKERGR